MKYKKRIGIDVDGVLRDMTSVTMELFKKHYPNKILSNVVDDWDFPNVNLSHEKKMDLIFNRFPREIFLHSKPFKDTKSEFKKLKTWATNENVHLVCTTHQKENLIGLTYIWLATYGFLFTEMHVGGNKHENPIDYLVDDSPRNYEKWVKAKRNPADFILFDATYNKQIDAPVRIKKLSEAIKHIKLK